MALEFQTLTRPRGTAPAALFDPLAYVTDPAPPVSVPPVSVTTQPEVVDRPSSAATPISFWRPRRFAAVGVVALAAAGWAASVLLTASPATRPAPVAASGASALTSPVLELPPPGVASGARSADLTDAVPAEPTAPPSKVVTDNTPPAATGSPTTRNAQSVKRAISAPKPPAAVASPSAPTRAEADQWSAAFGPDGAFWTAFRSERHGHR